MSWSKPVAVVATQGAWYGRWRVVSLDGSTMDVADEQANDEAFGRPSASRGGSAWPQFRFVSLVESGTHVLFGTRMAPYATGENTLAKEVLRALDSGMLCLADRGFFGFEMWRQALTTNAQLLWRVKKNAVLPCDQRLVDGSYLSRAYPSEKDRRHQTNGIPLRVIEYRLEGVSPAHLVLVTLQDLWLEGAPQNVPGTSEERPNWRRPRSHTIDDALADPQVAAALDDLAARRGEG